MSEELKPCPFCGEAGNLPHHQHKETCFYYLLDYASRKELRCSPQLLRKAWNTRPIEDALRAELGQARGEITRLAMVLRGIHEMASEDIRVGCTTSATCVWQIEADARAALPIPPELRD